MGSEATPTTQGPPARGRGKRSQVRKRCAEREEQKASGRNRTRQIPVESLGRITTSPNAVSTTHLHHSTNDANSNQQSLGTNVLGGYGGTSDTSFHRGDTGIRSSNTGP